MTQQLRVLVILEDPGSGPRILMTAHICNSGSQGSHLLKVFLGTKREGTALIYVQAKHLSM